MAWRPCRPGQARTHSDDNLKWADLALQWLNLAPARVHDPALQDYLHESQSCSIGNFSINHHISISFYYATGCTNLRRFVGTHSITAVATSIGLRLGLHLLLGRGITRACLLALPCSGVLHHYVLPGPNSKPLGFFLPCCR